MNHDLKFGELDPDEKARLENMRDQLKKLIPQKRMSNPFHDNSSIDDAAIGVLAFCKKNEFPVEGSQKFLELTRLIDRLETVLVQKYPQLLNNLREQ